MTATKTPADRLPARIEALPTPQLEITYGHAFKQFRHTTDPAMKQTYGTLMDFIAVEMDVRDHPACPTCEQWGIHAPGYPCANTDAELARTRKLALALLDSVSDARRQDTARWVASLLPSDLLHWSRHHGLILDGGKLNPRKVKDA